MLCAFPCGSQKETIFSAKVLPVSMANARSSLSTIKDAELLILLNHLALLLVMTTPSCCCFCGSVTMADVIIDRTSWGHEEPAGAARTAAKIPVTVHKLHHLGRDAQAEQFVLHLLHNKSK
jgi:hypothetical protein